MQIFIHPALHTGTIQRDNFLGFTLDIDQFGGSDEESCISDFRRPELVALFAEVRPASIRIGGGGIEHTTYTADGSPGEDVCGGPVQLTPGKLQALVEFTKAVSSRLILSCPMRSDRALADSHAIFSYAIRDLKAPVAALEMSNEPDWGWNSAMTEYGARTLKWHAALAPEFPGLPWLAGFGGRSFPSGICMPDSVPYLEFMEQAGHVIDILTSHYYVTSSRRPYASAELLMLPASADILVGRVHEQRLVQTVAGLRKPVSINEFNSFAFKGKEAVSNRVAAALWLADFIGSLVKAGTVWNCLQCGFGKQHGEQPFWRYALVDTRGPQLVIAPHYWAFLLWQRFMFTEIIAVARQPHPAIAVHASRSSETGQLRLLLINKGAEPQTADLRVGQESTAGGHMLCLTGAALDSPELRLAGQGTTPSPRWDELYAGFRPVDLQGGLELPPYSITAVELAE